jgi:putative ABC transport system ATP-binding protein
MTAALPLIQLEAVSRVFDEGSIVAITDIDLAISPGESLAIVGASGSGKSSLVNLMSGIDLPSSGRVLWQGQPSVSRHEWTARRGRHIGIVFQEFNLLPTLTAIENVEMARLGHGVSASERRAAALAALTRVGLAARLHHLPQSLSGGERQRTAIARSIVNGPQLILADEPTGNLDSTNSVLVMDLLFELQRANGMALVLVTHDEALARLCERCIRLKDGRIVDDRRQIATARPHAEEATA